MKKICVFTLYSDKGASSQFRTYIYKNALEHDFDVRWFYFWNEKYVTKYMVNKRKYLIQIFAQYVISTIKRTLQLLFIAPHCNVLYIQKTCFPKLKILMLKHLKNKVRIVFDVDDAVYLSKGDNSDRIAAVSNAVICGNENLKEHYSHINKQCYVIPTVENTNVYVPFWKDTFDQKSIGWIGSKATLDNLDLIVDPINNVIQKHPEVKFYIISNDPGDYIKRIANAVFIPWKKETYIEELSKFTIGIMPLKDTDYNRGKCGFKLIQYLNMRKPVIGSPVGVNRNIIFGNGLLVEDEKQWETAFEEILFDRNLYESFIDHIDHNFFKEYHFDTAYGKLKEILEG